MAEDYRSQEQTPDLESQIDLLENIDIQALHDAELEREREAKDETGRTTRLIIGLCVLLVVWGGCYLMKYNGAFKANIFDAKATDGKIAAPKPVDPIVMGKRYYAVNCAACHQGTGLGVPGQYPPLAGSKWVTGDEERLDKIVLNGVDGFLKVKGETYNGAMPAWEDVLNDDQIASILTYIRSAWGNEAPAVTAETVAEDRAEFSDHDDPWTAKELEA
jgi:mono/diheme cytochrome c family protein